jgi:YVTN family beta-propeller protein
MRVQADVVIDKVPVGTYPTAIAVNPMTNKAYVAGSGSELLVIDGKDNSTQSVKVGQGFKSLLVNVKANEIFVASARSLNGGPVATLSVINGTDHSRNDIFRIRWDHARRISFDIAGYNSKTNSIYALFRSYGWGGDSIIEIHRKSGRAQTIARGWYTKATVGTATNKLYAADFFGHIAVINLKDYATHLIQAGVDPNAFAINPVTNTVYVVNSGSGDVTVIDGTIYKTNTVEVGKTPFGIAVNSATNRIYVTDSHSDSVTVIDGTDNSTISVATGEYPRSVAVNPATNKIYVANYDGATVTVIHGKDNSTETIPVGKTPVAIAVNPENGRVYVANKGSESVTVIDGS